MVKGLSYLQRPPPLERGFQQMQLSAARQLGKVQSDPPIILRCFIQPQEQPLWVEVQHL
jgi:hypothetical protein